MSASTQLNLRQVAQLIKRSTKSVRNYIKAGRLRASKVESVNGPEYSFSVTDVIDFAKADLGIDLVIGETLEREGDNKAVPMEQADLVDGEDNTLPMIPYHDQKLDLSQFTQVLLSLENDKMKLIEDFGEYKARLAYKMGQLESQVKQLESGADEKERLKKKVIDLEKNYKVRDMDARQLLAMKEFYESRPWWKFWQKFDLKDSEKLVGGSY